MFVVILDYLADLTEIDEALSDHAEWLEHNYQNGLFLASGRREPRTGGVILATGTRDDVERAITEDPFALRGLARHTVIEFTPSRFGGALDSEPVRAALN